METQKLAEDSFDAQHQGYLRRDEGRSVIENWNGANDFILYGRGGEISVNRVEDQEITMLGLHLLQVCSVYVNTFMIKCVLTEPGWAGRLTAEHQWD